MTDLVDRAVERLRALPPEEGDAVARTVLKIMGEEEPSYRLTLQEEEDLNDADAEIARGEIATDAEVRAVWAKHGL